jgi:hypothetical protein
MFLASLDPTYQEASDTSRRALMQTSGFKEEMARLTQDAEYLVHQQMGITKDELAYAAYFYPVFTGKISTKPFKNFKYETKNYTIIPEFEYELNSKGYSTTVYLNFKADF